MHASSTFNFSLLAVAFIAAFTSFSPSHSFAQECGVIYISPSGVNSGVAGTRANPASLAYGLSLHSQSDSILWLAQGSYSLSNTLSLPSNIILEGGFNPATWVKSNANITTVQRDTFNSDIANKALVAIEILNRQNVRLQDLTIEVADAPRDQFSVYGVRLSNTSNYNIVRCIINSGNSGPGTDGEAGANGGAGGDGGDGVIGSDDDDNYIVCGGTGGTGGGPTGGMGGQGGCSGSQNGGHGIPPSTRCGGGGGGAGAGGGQGDDDGGNGGFGGGWLGNNTNWGTGGDASGWCNNTSNCNTSLSGSDGGNGVTGATGGPGGPGPFGTHVGGFYIPGAQAPSGECGEGGQGGAGGGGGAGEGNPFCEDGTGSSGAAGGGGGEGGHGGKGGTGGGSTYAIYIFNGGPNGNIIDCDLNPGTWGPGGVGGPGGQGGMGGPGGAGAPWFDSDLGCSGDGGDGGMGGQGGPGGNGADGQSVQVYQHPGGIFANVSGVNAIPGNAIISVDYNGCPNMAVNFGASILGNWDFGLDASPSTASGSAATTQYNSLGRKTFEFDGTDFTDYIHIFNSGISGSDFIQPGDTTLVVGCPYLFSSSLAGSFYDWDFGAGVSPVTMSGSNVQTIDSVTFSTPGTYTVKLTVTLANACCNSAIDYTTVTVIPNPLNLTLSAQPATACFGDSLTISATPAIFNSYEFFVNGVSVQNSGTNKLISTNLLPTDSIYVIGTHGDCQSNPSPIFLPPISIGPNLNLFASDDTICPGQFVTFTAILVTHQNYDWFDNGTLVQSGSSFLHITNTLQPGNSIYVQADDGGCPGFPSNPISVIVEQTFIVDLGPDTALCPGETLILDAGHPGSSYLWSDGSTQQTLSISTNGQFYVSVTDGSGCISSDTIDINLPIPLPTVDTIVWTGIKSTDWFNPCNWDKITLPDTSLHVIIPGGTLFNPTIAGDTATCKTITTFHQNGGHVIYDYGSGGKLLKRP